METIKCLKGKCQFNVDAYPDTNYIPYYLNYEKSPEI